MARMEIKWILIWNFEKARMSVFQKLKFGPKVVEILQKYITAVWTFFDHEIALNNLDRAN